MEIAIVVFVITALIGSVMWVKPSPRQAELGRLRQAAYMCGMKVLKIDSGKGWEILGESHDVMMYYRLARTKAVIDSAFWYRNNGSVYQPSVSLGERWLCYGDLYSDSIKQQVLQVLSEVPECFAAVEKRGSQYCLIWNERSGNEAAVKKGGECLERLEQILKK